jgi:deazaflavin-dependent oxidoreductase (nitroreductase family)
MTRLFGRIVPGMFRRRQRRTAGGIITLLLETRGAKSGKPRHAMLGFLEDGPDAWLVVASAAGGPRHPSWVYNLAAEPRATIEFFGGDRVAVEAETLEGADLDAAWKRLEAEAPEYPAYLAKTDRQIPVIRLRRTRVSPSAAGDRE